MPLQNIEKNTYLTKSSVSWNATPCGPLEVNPQEIELVITAALKALKST
jgi:hypothetical protein